MKLLVVGLFISLVVVMSLYAQQDALQPTPVVGLTVGQLLSFTATWLGVAVAYWNLNRTLRIDNDKRTKELCATLLAAYDKELMREISMRNSTLMSRELQMEINAQTNHKINLLSNNQDLCSRLDNLIRIIQEKQ